MRRGTLFSFIGVGLVAAVAAFVLGRKTTRDEANTPVTFSGTSDELKSTVVVPTLDTPKPEGKSVIWCAAFELAWKTAKDDVFKGPLLTQNAPEIAARLNSAPVQTEDLAPNTFVAQAGFVKDGISEKIRSELAQKFPGAQAPEFKDLTPDSVVAYAYLVASVPFQIPFFENDGEFTFKSSTGAETNVGSFGIRSRDHDAYNKLRRQVDVLFFTRRANTGELDEFAIDPCKTSSPYQIVLASIKPQGTLAEDIARIAELATSSQRDIDFHTLGPCDVLLLPNMHWEVAHSFNELHGPLLNQGFSGYRLTQALERLRFRLDRSGAELAAEAKVICAPIPNVYLFDRPFLLYIQKRGAARPCFAMWVDNAELLQKR